MARVSPASSEHLHRHAQIVTHTFILEAVGGETFVFACMRFVRLKMLPLNVNVGPYLLNSFAFSWGGIG